MVLIFIQNLLTFHKLYLRKEILLLDKGQINVINEIS